MLPRCLDGDRRLLATGSQLIIEVEGLEISMESGAVPINGLDDPMALAIVTPDAVHERIEKLFTAPRKAKKLQENVVEPPAVVKP